MQVADALSQVTRIKSGVPQGSVIGPLLFLFFVNYLPSVINVITLLIADDDRMASPRSQCDRLQGSLHNVWNWSVNWELPINPTKCNKIAIERALPLQISFASGVQSISHRSQTLLKTWAYSWTVPSNPPSISERPPSKQDVYCL